MRVYSIGKIVCRVYELGRYISAELVRSESLTG